MWDHLTYRYDNIYLTETFKDLVSDKDFKFLVAMSLQSVLKKQESRLEKECLRFGIPLPKKPVRLLHGLQIPNILFRMILYIETFIPVS